ncbi:zf-HC2 domain-containing protein [uncultured Marinobacter sp.]|uniref:zf-HC2 domain-containing protein n=1 Tax=uncultured Marinobacter sp. TaxID=187379 RepID=UPI00260F178E|nr:zf-HC2 domain-containing protein [uncultured Marinobacter sp.]
MLMCRDLARIASDYIDDELGTRQNLSVKVHLMMCKGCRTFIDNLRTSTELMTYHSSFKVDEDFLRRIDERVTDALKAHQSGKSNQD